MSNVQATIKAADQVSLSLLDQRKFILGQIEYLIRNFTEIKLEDNFNRLLGINQKTCVMADVYTGDMCCSCDAYTQQLRDKVTELVDKTEDLIKIEEQQKLRVDDLLADERRDREDLVMELKKSLSIKIDKTKESLLREELDLERKYLKFEENLRNNL